MHFSCIEASGYRELRAGQNVRFTAEDPGFLQDGCRFRALRVWPETDYIRLPHYTRQLRTFTSSAAMYKYTAG